MLIVRGDNLKFSYEQFMMLFYIGIGISIVFFIVAIILFFVLKLRLFSFIWILILDILVAIMIISFYKKNKVAGLLQIPYIIWIIFASYLNIAIYILNK